jgi:hypothetical protein
MSGQDDETTLGNEANNQANPTPNARPGFQIPPQGRIPGNDEAPNPTGKAESATAKELHWLEKLNFGGQLALVIVGVIGLIIYGCELHSMNSQLKDSEAITRFATNTEIASRKPIVFPIGSFASLVKKDGKPYIRLIIRLQNVGETDAVSPVFSWGYSSDKPKQGKVRFQRINVSSWSTSAWSKGVWVEDSYDIPMDEAETLSKGPFFIFIMTRYIDIFPTVSESDGWFNDHQRRDHRVQSSIEVRTLDLPDVLKLNGKLLDVTDTQVSPEWSCLDAQCPDYTNEKYDPAN